MIVQVITAAKFSSWLAYAVPGDRCVYHRGSLVADRRGGEIGAVASLAYVAQLGGAVLLTQRRHGEGDYDFIATRSTKRLSYDETRDMGRLGRRLGRNASVTRYAEAEDAVCDKFGLA